MAFYGILWHFDIFDKKSNRKSNPIFPILSNFFPIFRLFPTFRLLDSTTLIATHLWNIFRHRSVSSTYPGQSVHP